MKCCTCIVCLFAIYSVMQMVYRWEKEIILRTNFYEYYGIVDQEGVVRWADFKDALLVQDDTFCVVNVNVYSNETDSYKLYVNKEERTFTQWYSMYLQITNMKKYVNIKVKSMEETCKPNSKLILTLVNVGCP